MAPRKRRRERSPTPATPAQVKSNGILTPPPSSAKKVVKHSPRQTPRRNLLAYFSSPDRVVKEEHEDDQAQDHGVVVKKEEEQVQLALLPAERPDNLLTKNEEDEDKKIKVEDVLARDQSPTIKPEPGIKAEEPDDVYRFPFEYAPHNGKTILEVPESFLKQLYTNGDIERSPNLKRAIVEWASKWTFTSGVHEGRLLDDVPIAYINDFILNWGKRDEPKDDGLCVAWKYHLPQRTPEVPGSNYRFTFSQYRGCTIEEAINRSQRNEWDDRESTFITWAKDEGVPEQPGYEGLAEAIELHAKETAFSFVLEHPHVVNFNAPNHPCFDQWVNMPFLQVPDYILEFLRTEIGVDELNAMAPGMEDALKYSDLMRDTCRWNWRRTPGCETHAGLGPLLYPTTAVIPDKEAGFVVSWGHLWERVQTGYSTISANGNNRERKKWVWKLVEGNIDSW